MSGREELVLLAELAIATAAFKTVKEFIAEGKELAEMGGSLMNYFDAKNKLQKELNKSNKSDKSDLEEFMALEQIKQQEDELRQMMIYCGRPGMWQDWLNFQSQAARKREEQRKEEQRRRIQQQEQFAQFAEIAIAIVLIVLVGGFIIWFISGIMSS